MSERSAERMERMFQIGVITERKRIDSAFKKHKRFGWYYVKAILPDGIMVEYQDGSTEIL